MLYANEITAAEWDVPYSKAIDGSSPSSLQQGAPELQAVLQRPLSISTITVMFKPVEPPEGHGGPPKYNIPQVLDFLRHPANKPLIDEVMMTFLHARFPLRLKHISPKLADEPGASSASGDEQQPAVPAKKKRKGDGYFLNQITMSYEDEMSNKSIKIFRNRTIHITGCKSPTEARVVASFVWGFLCKVYPDTHDIVYQQRILMVNATCELNYSFNPSVNQLLMSEKYRSLIQYVVTGKTRKYPGTILKLSGQAKDVTVLMFASGNLTFSCASLRDMVGAYRFVMDYYRNEKACIMSREPILSKRKLESTRPKRKYVVKKPRKNARQPDFEIV